MKAVIVQPDRTVKVQERADPDCGPKDIVFRVKAFGQNPTDWKHAASIGTVGSIIGCDACGEVTAVGKDVPASSGLSKGTRVGTFVRGGKSHLAGAFAEFCATPYDLVFRIAPNLSYEEAATIPIPFFTAWLLISKLGMEEPSPNKSLPMRDNGKWALVWSGASAVGQYAIQLAKLAGYRVVTTASSSNWAHLKELGASHTFDYKDADASEKIRELTKDSLGFAFDCVSVEESQDAAGKALSSKGGKLGVVLPPQREKVASNVEIVEVLAYTCLTGKAEAFGDWVVQAGPADRENYVRWLQQSTALFERGLVKPLPIYPAGGLQDVQKGFTMMAENDARIRGKKMVYSLQ